MAIAQPAKISIDEGEEATKNFLEFVKKRTRFKWNASESSNDLLLKNNNLTIYKENYSDKSNLAKGNQGFTSGIHIFEVNSPVKKRGKICIVGFSTKDAQLDREEQQQLCGSNNNSFGWDLNKNNAVWGSGRKMPYPADISDDFEAPDFFYMILDMRSGCLSFRSDSVEYGSCCTCLERIFRNVPLYPTVNISSKGSEVSMALIYSNNSPNDDIGDISTYSSLWKELAEKMKVRSLSSTNYINEKLKLFSNIPRVADTLTTSMYTHLIIDYDETESLINYLKYLQYRSKRTNLSNPLSSILSFLLRFTSKSRKFSKTIVNRGCLDIIVGILDNILRVNQFTDLRSCRWKVFGLIMNISSVSAIQDVMNREDLKSSLMEIYKKEDKDSCLLLNLICLMNILSEKEKATFDLKDSALRLVVKLVVDSSKYVGCKLSKYDKESAVDDTDQCFIIIYPRVAFSLLSGTLTSDNNSLTLLKGCLIESLLKIFQKVDKVQEHAHHIELALHCLSRCLQTVISVSKDNKSLLTDEVYSNIRNRELQEFLKKFSSKYQPSIVNVAKICEARIHEITNGAAKKKKCEIEKIVTSFVRDYLKIDVKTYIDSRFNRCHCRNCHLARGGSDYKSQGEPSRMYPVPIGWFKFGLKLPSRHADKSIDALKKWQIAYHGTSYNNIVPILQHGNFLKPGDTTLDGKKIRPPEWHFTEDNKPEGFNVNQTFLSPSIFYSELYCDQVSFKDKTFKTAFQVLVKPDVYTVGPETMNLGTTAIDPRLPNDELEWMTYHCGAIFLYGFLVKVQ
ncbi:DgyrCDS4910 [Dimorphilus gyrociliatus]|uniref:DgyrCDS4910 n=1 Tax=Dimorphilus gyrociliatus TaxID=2664684 RepID=A0A7I8VKK7_9ANNE|nr:DgyrCDS4910 [Dimorphilus gyrociliatus]